MRLSKRKEYLSRKKLISACLTGLLLCLFLPAGVSYARTSIVVTPAGGVTIDTANQDNLARQVQERSDLNGPFLADAFAFANITGYPIGHASIGTFPHFEIGASVGAGCTNMQYFADREAAKAEGSFPMIVPNPVLHFGVGLAGGLDLIGKIFIFDAAFYTPDYETDLAKPEKFSIYSIGGRLRYNIVEHTTIVPFIFSFGGITASIGADVMSGSAKITGKYDTTFNGISVTYTVPPPTVFTLDTNFTSSYEAEITWVVYSATTNLVAFVDLFTFFSFYSGFGLSVGSGYFKTSFTANGALTTDFIAPGTSLGTMTFESENKYKPHIFIPHYILGLEIDLFVIKINLETMVNLRNGEDVTALVGVRTEL